MVASSKAMISGYFTVHSKEKPTKKQIKERITIMKRKVTVILSMMIVAMLAMSTVGLASMLPISAAAAKKVIDIIDAGSTIATIVSLVAAVVGAGVVSTGIIATAKALIKKYGKRYAAAW